MKSGHDPVKAGFHKVEMAEGEASDHMIPGAYQKKQPMSGQAVKSKMVQHKSPLFSGGKKKK